MSSRTLWVLLRQYLGCGLRSLRLRGLLLSARGGTFLSESWLQALSTKCPRLRKLYLLHTDLRGLTGCHLLPPSLQMLELSSCELPLGFFNQILPSSTVQERAEPSSSEGARLQELCQKERKLCSPSGTKIETLVLNNVPSFTDHHLQSLNSWERLSRLELRDTFRVTANGLRSCAAKDGACGVEGLSRLKFLEIGINGRQGYQLQMASLGLGAGWLGLEELSLGGREVGPGLLCASRLKDLKRLCLWACTLSEMQIVRSCRLLRGLRQLEFVDVVFQSRQSSSVLDGDGSGEEEPHGEDSAAAGDSNHEENETLDAFSSLRRSLALQLPFCTYVFTNCSVQINAD